MIMFGLAPLALTASTALLLGLPLLPSLLELRSRRDAGPLEIRKDDGDIRNFARAFRSRCEALRPQLERCAELGMNERRLLADGTTALFLGSTTEWRSRSQCNVLVLSAPALRLPQRAHLMNDVYAQREVFTGKQNVLRALLGETDIVLDEGTRIARWIHAEGSLTAKRNCVLFGRASAEQFIVLAEGCTFERMFSPVIYSSESARKTKWREREMQRSLPVRRRSKQQSIHLHDHQEHYGDLISATQVTLDSNVTVIGNLKANGDAKVGAGSEVDGALVSAGSICVESDCFIKGPVIAEKEIVMSSGCQIGLPGSPTTISAPRIVLAPGVVVHGTIWARKEGCVQS